MHIRSKNLPHLNICVCKEKKTLDKRRIQKHTHTLTLLCNFTIFYEENFCITKIEKLFC